ncbi:MAG: hypothetical protein KDD82_21080 [Planctomycetes bacterium]|nr:hypothetical protein [Planctomycetota bacterium]
MFGVPLATRSSAGWVYPLTPLARLTRALRVALGWGLLALALLALILGVLWGVPAWAAASSPAYALAKARAGEDRELPPFLGSPVECERVPTHYRLGGDASSFRFWVQGPRGRALVNAQVEGERVTRFSLIRVRFGE